MKNILLLLCSAILLFSMSRCSKGNGGGGGGGETPIQVTLTPPAGSVQPAAPGPTFPLTVQVTAGMPAAGVNIKVSVAQDGSSNNFFNYNQNTTSAQTDITITGTVAGVVCVVTVTVTSQSSPSNKWTGSYRYSMK